MNKSKLCVLIVTHKRPRNVRTIDALRRGGYTGEIFLVLDDGDPTANEYREIYGDSVVVFSRADALRYTDDADNRPDLRGVVYARNACFDVARGLGYKYFLVLDDDYSGFYLRFNSSYRYGNTTQISKSLDSIFRIMLEFFVSTPALTVALSQGGDHIGGSLTGPRLRRKAMNAFFCSTDRPFAFVGRLNEDVNTYLLLGNLGHLFFTVMQAQLTQLMTQSNPGGLTELYLDSGTYVKSFYSILYCPSCTKIGILGDPRSPHRRIHHAIEWEYAVPKILNEKYRKSA